MEMSTEDISSVIDQSLSRNSFHEERWLVTGATGQLGMYLLSEARRVLLPSATICGVARRHGPEHGIIAADLTEDDATKVLLAHMRPTHIVHLAGVARPLEAEQDPDRAYRLNVSTTRVLADHAERTNAWMLFASTDFVLEGEAPGRQDEAAPTSSRTVYGRTKLQGESEVLRRKAGCVARLAMLWGVPASGSAGGWAAITDTLRAGGELRAVVDEIRTPLHFAAASRLILALGKMKFRGLINIGGEDMISPYDFLCKFRDSIKSSSVIKPVTRMEYSPCLPRPRNAALEIELLKQVLGGHRMVPTPERRDAPSLSVT
jgi:dTDP-4-dehydrorhamnose reductase